MKLTDLTPIWTQDVLSQRSLLYHKAEEGTEPGYRAFVVALQRQIDTYLSSHRQNLNHWLAWAECEHRYFFRRNSGCATACGWMLQLLDQMIVFTYNIRTYLITFVLAPPSLA
jgi:hypothetical protein